MGSAIDMGHDASYANIVILRRHPWPDLFVSFFLAPITMSRQEIIRFLSRHFNIPEDTVVRRPPYRSYALYLARKHTPTASADIGRYFKVTCSAVTKMGTRLKQKLEQDGTLRDTMRRIEEGLSHVNG